jgi:hypothetical protein
MVGIQFYIVAACLYFCTQLDFKRNLHGVLGANRFGFLQQCDLLWR